MNYFKENEIQKIRLEESQKHRLALEGGLKKELEADYHSTYKDSNCVVV